MKICGITTTQKNIEILETVGLVISITSFVVASITAFVLAGNARNFKILHPNVPFKLTPNMKHLGLVAISMGFFSIISAIGTKCVSDSLRKIENADVPEPKSIVNSDPSAMD